ncbi:MAG TPA: alpha/beta hydrolase-fold protein [Polyangia bacterium]|jgi:S-formylglutathione hydrolase FrmB
MTRFALTRVVLVGSLIVAASGCSSSSSPVATGSGGVAGGGSGGSGSGGSPPASGGSSGSGGSGGNGGSTVGSGGAVVTDAGNDVTADTTSDTAFSGFGGVLPDVTADGDGDRTIGPTYKRDPLLSFQNGVPKGRMINFTMTGAQSQIYKGVNGAYNRSVSVYVPMQYVPGTPAPFIVTQDAMGTDTVPPALDNLIAMNKMPKLVVLFVQNGGGDAMGSERGLEYDTVSGLFATFVIKEVLPRAITEVKNQLQIDLAFTDDPNGHGTFGGSSGGAASFSMAWWHPDLFRRVLTYSGTFVSQVPAGAPFPHGCWVYHDIDPHFVDPMADPAHGLIVQQCEPKTGADKGSDNPGPCDTPLTQADCQTAGCVWNTTVNKPIRVWLESADGDLGTPGHLLDVKYGPIEYRDFNLANIRMALSMKTRGYHYHYDHALGAGHVDGNVVGQTLAEALQWVWRGYPVN